MASHVVCSQNRSQGYSEETSLIAASYFYASFSWADFHRLTLGIWRQASEKNFESQSTSYGFSHLFYDAVLHFGFYNSIKQPYSARWRQRIFHFAFLLGQICLNPWILSVFFFQYLHPQSNQPIFPTGLLLLLMSIFRAQGYKFQYIQFYKWNRPFVRKCFHGIALV